MKFIPAAMVGVLVLLSACEPTQEAATPVADQPSANALFDAAVQEMTMAYFYHVPEADSQLGVSEDVVPGTAHRMMDRSVDGNVARNVAIEAALADLTSISAESLS